MGAQSQAGEDRDLVRRVADWLTRAREVLVITGAGLSADSGLPTYRGIGGLYQDRETEDGMPIEAALSGAMLETRPEIVWRHLLRMDQACRGAAPNRGHQVIADLERRLERVWVLTQNIDGLHRAAGSRNCIEIHGDLHRLVCTGCPFRHRVADLSGLKTLPPRCPECGSGLRPEVVLFGEALPAAAVRTLRAELERGFDLVLSVGTTSVFPYIAEPVLAAKAAGVPTVEINPGESRVSEIVDVRLRAGAARTLDEIWTAAFGRTGEEA